MPNSKSFVCAGLAFASLAFGNPAFKMTVAPDAATQGGAYGSNFAGLSFEVNDLKPNYITGGFLFDANPTQSPKCDQVIRLFENMGLKSLRLGGSWGEGIVYGTDYTDTGIDALFAFAKEAGIKVILQVRLKGTTDYDPQTGSVKEASYVWRNYEPQVDFFSLGNEPNWKSYHTNTLLGAASKVIDPEIYETNATDQRPGSAYPSYAHNAAGNPVDGKAGKWKRLASAIASATSPTVRFGGPDTADENGGTTTWWFNGTANVSWTQSFVDDAKSGNITAPLIVATHHNYPGGNGLLVSSALTATTDMLSPAWLSDYYTNQYNTILKPVSKIDGWKFRFTEANDYTSGVPGASNTFAGALWALDYMHWQVQNDTNCIGVNFHNNLTQQSDGSYGIPTATLWRDNSGNFHSRPKAAAVKMFALGGIGNKYNTATITKSDASANANAYAVGTSTDMYVTIINKANSYVGGDCADALTTVAPSHFKISHAYYIEMDSYPATHDVQATEATVGGISVNNNSSGWNGTWQTLTVSSNTVQVSVPAATAGIVHLTTY